ncbi:hypothetical protein BKA70DRAFT_1105175 [Coprinopsis sp. MPI-PUGE-AT-0042]|nr:hypothetical protein BKA70DRAFT_1105175 [Coprinopsis sp. MPI-PUGE-AT-0042]
MPLFTTSTIPVCPASCGRIFKNEKGLNTHLSTARSCKWYQKGKLRDLGTLPAPLSPHDGLRFDWNDDAWPEPEDYDDANPDAPFDLDEQLRRQAYDLLNAEPVAGPGPSTQAHHRKRLGRVETRMLDDDEEHRVEVHPFPRAGEVVGSHASHTDAAADNLSQKYAPFTSEMDWQVANWVIADGPSSKAVDRFLSIPGLREKLDLSYSNTKALHKKVDAMPERAGAWKTEDLHFSDLPDQNFTIRYRDPIEAIRTLWRDPKLQRHLVYSPKKVYSDSTKTNRIFSEMWTGQWWHMVQVSPSHILLLPRLILSKL